MNEVPDHQEVYVEEERGHYYMTKADLLLLIENGFVSIISGIICINKIEYMGQFHND